MRIPLRLLMSQIVCMNHCLLQPDELLFTLVVKRVAMDIKNISQSQDSHSTASMVEEMEHMEDTLSVVRGRGKEAKIPSSTNGHWHWLTQAELLCPGQTMGNLLVTWFMVIFKQFPRQYCLPVLLCTIEFELSV